MVTNSVVLPGTVTLGSGAKKERVVAKRKLRALDRSPGSEGFSS